MVKLHIHVWISPLKSKKEGEGESLALLQIRDLILGHFLGHLIDLDKYKDAKLKLLCKN